MFSIKYATEHDKGFWFTLDRHMAKEEYDRKVRDERCYIISDGEIPIGVMRYNLFWDCVPFLTLIYFKEEYRKKGFGKLAMQHWEDEMRILGYKWVMTSTQADEDAQHFYRKLGFRDAGALVQDIPLEQPLEIFLVKEL